MILARLKCRERLGQMPVHPLLRSEEAPDLAQLWTCVGCVVCYVNVTRYPSPLFSQGRSPNRFSGFFSHLIHRRDHVPPPPGAVTVQEQTNSPDGSTLPSREPSPAPVPRPSTPPPPLSSPSLVELGLSLTVLTEHLSPSHFSTPPTSGAFLAPHY